jgi:hypothetical protein
LHAGADLLVLTLIRMRRRQGIEPQAIALLAVTVTQVTHMQVLQSRRRGG